jgi:hypothetical protein
MWNTWNKLYRGNAFSVAVALTVTRDCQNGITAGFFFAPIILVFGSIDMCYYESIQFGVACRVLVNKLPWNDAVDIIKSPDRAFSDIAYLIIVGELYHRMCLSWIQLMAQL